ncbi:MAG: hypothetical protein ACU84Q_03500 [Gammaproteobacteria bacterium]
MSRYFFIQAHLLLAAFFAPIILLMAVSGGLYLIGVKGSVSQTEISAPAGANVDLSSETIEEQVRALIENLNPGFSFEYLKVKDGTLYTRPTSKAHYEIKVAESGLQIFYNEPSVQKALVELHKGHGPTSYKTFQKAMAAGLIFVLLSGVWLGLSSRALRLNTMAMLVLGSAAAGALALLI